MKPIEKDRADREFAEMLKSSLPALRQRALKLTRKPAEADDLVQQTVLRALEASPGLKSSASFLSWMAKAMRNLHADNWQRRRTRSRQIDPDRAIAASASEFTPLPERVNPIRDISTSGATRNPPPVGRGKSRVAQHKSDQTFELVFDQESVSASTVAMLIETFSCLYGGRLEIVNVDVSPPGRTRDPKRPSGVASGLRR